MKARRILGLSILVLLALCASAGAWDEDVVARLGLPDRAGEARQQAALSPCVSANFSYDIGDLWFPGIYTVGLSLYTGYYPGAAENQQIFQSGLWAGGYVEGAVNDEVWTAIGCYDQLDFVRYDTVCSGFQVASPGRSSVDVVSTFNTGDSPRDLGMTVTTRYMMWSDPRYDDFVMVRLDLKFEKAIKHFWWGWMTDCDVGNNTLSDYYYDDLVGFDTRTGTAYMYDDDGDPAILSDRKSKLLSPTHVGQVLLSAPTTGGRITEPASPSVVWETSTWWDWNNDVTGDASAYERMANGTIKQSPPEQPFDYRMLTAVGPYEVEAGDSATMYFAIVFGEGLDAEYWARRAKLGGSITDLTPLVTNVEYAKALLAAGLVVDDPAPEPPLLYEPVSSGRTVSLHWESAAEEDDDFAGYRIYRSNVSNVGPWDLIGDSGSRPYANTYDDTLKIGFPTFYMVTGYDQAGNESTKGAAGSKTIGGVYATTLPSDDDGDCQASCEEQCQGCPECLETCLEECLKQKARRALDNVLVAPNPYRGSGNWERLDYEGRLSFLNLPRECDVYIYALTGEQVAVVHHNTVGDDSPDPAGNETGGESWDMLTGGNQSIASGIYIFRVVSDGYGEKIGKFAVIKGDR